MTLRIPTDMDILNCCEENAKNTYQIAKQLKLQYGVVLKHIEKLTSMKLLYVSRRERGRGPTGEVEFHLVTSKGVAILRGYKEGLR